MECFNDELTTNKITVNGDVIFTGALIGNNCLIKNNVTISHTGTTDETILYSVLIPAGTFEANDDFDFFLNFFGTNNANLKTVRAYFNDTIVLVGAQKIGQNNSSTAAISPLGRTVVLTSLTTQQVMRNDANYPSDKSTSSSRMDSLTIDFTVAQYLIITGQLADASDTMGIRNVRGQILR
jgi:hypothetical protein